MRLLSTILLTLFSALTLSAQKVQVTQEIDSLQILIGDQCHVFLTITAPQKSDISVPDFGAQHLITPGVEVVEIAKTDSTILDDGFLRQTVVYTITSFEPKVHLLPPFTIVVDGKKHMGKKLALKVLDVPVDTTKLDQFYPAKDVQKNPFSWDEWIPLIILYFFASLFAVLGMLSYLLKKSNKPIRITFRTVKRVPAHVKAMAAIDTIKAQQLTQGEDQKVYYTQLTDTLRHYLEERFGFSAMEMTTREIIDRLQSEDPTKVAELRELFETADLVKFAKYSAFANENDRNLLSAMDFINSTKTTEVVEEHKEEEQLSDAQRQINIAHRFFKYAIYACVIMASAIIAFILWQIVGLIE